MRLNSNKIISGLMILIYSIWVIIPRIYYSISVVYIITILCILLLLLCIKNRNLITAVAYISFGAIFLALMYFFIAYPLDIKHSILVIMEQLMMFIPMILVYNAFENYTRKEIFFCVALIAVLELYVGISTYSELKSNPMIARMLTSGESKESKDISYRLANIGGYGSIYSFIFFYMSGLVTVFSKKNISIKIVSIVICIFSFLFLMKAQFGTAIMLLILSTGFVFFSKINSFKFKVIVIFLGFVGIFMLPILLNILANYAGIGILNERLTAISEFLINKSTDDVDLVLRQELLKEGFFIFFQSPIWGQKISINGIKVINLYSHSSYLDLACATGIIGLGIYLKTWSFINKKICKFLYKNKKIYRYGYLIFFILGMINPNWAVYQINVIAFLYFPLVLYLL